MSSLPGVFGATSIVSNDACFDGSLEIEDLAGMMFCVRHGDGWEAPDSSPLGSALGQHSIIIRKKNTTKARIIAWHGTLEKQS